jgi:hypothetical protein
MADIAVNLHELEEKEEELNEALTSSLKRVGKFSSSEFHKLMTSENKIDELPKGALTHIMEKVSEILTGSCDYGNGLDTFEMQWGRGHELEAIERFETETGLSVSKKGDQQEFMLFDRDDLPEYEILKSNVGATPDGVIDDKTNIEIKCPSSENHLSYIMDLEILQTPLKKAKKEYYWQTQGQMLMNGKTKTYFCSYDPRQLEPKDQIMIIEVEANEEDQANLLKRLKMAVEKRDEIVKKFEAKNASID